MTNHQGNNPFRLDPMSDPFEIFWHKFHMTPQCLAVGPGEDPKLLYDRAYEVKVLADVPAGKVAIVYDEVTHRYELHDRELFMRPDVKVDPMTGEQVK